MACAWALNVMEDQIQATLSAWPMSAAASAKPPFGTAFHASAMINWAAQIWQLRGLVFLLAGDLGECRKGFGVGVVVEHVLAGPLTCAEIPAAGD